MSNISHRPRGMMLAASMVVAATALLSGCASVYREGAATGAGIAGASIASAVTDNATVATGIGLGVVAGARAGVQYSERVAHRYTQETIAQAAGVLEVGAVAPWATHHSTFIEADEQGRVTVSRVISAGALDCKEIVFSVDTKPKAKASAAANTAADSAVTTAATVQSAFYVAAICRDGEAWKWASAEPATPRWGALQ